MSADHPRRTSSSRQRSATPGARMSHLFASEASSSPRNNRIPLQEPSRSPLAPDASRESTFNGPALPPLSARSSSILTQQPLPPLRFLNSRFSPPPVPANAQPAQNQNQNQNQNRNRSSQQLLSSYPPSPLAVFPRSTSSDDSDSQRSFAPRYTRRPRPTFIDEIGHDLEHANSHLRALLDLPAPNDLLNQLPPLLYPPLAASTMASRPGGAAGAGSRRESSRADETGRLSKRRKIDPEKTVPPPYKAFRYGRYGQVEPGALTMEIVSCDGGLYSDGSSYAAENILKNDNTVYCTKGNRCNIVLQHQGCTTFSLKELIIKAPGRNYSSPVKEGMVFLSMSKDELLQTEQYQSNVTPPTSLFQHIENLRARALRTGRQALGYLDRDENDNAGSFNGSPLDEIYNLALERPGDGLSGRADGDAATNQPTFHVLTECSDDEDDEIPGRLGRERYGRGIGWRNSNVGWSPTPLRNRVRRRLPVYNEASPLGAHLSWDVDRNFDDEDEDDDYTELYDLGNATISSPDSPQDDGEGAHGTGRARDRDRHDRAHSRSGGQRRDGEEAPAALRNTGATPFFESRANVFSLRNEGLPSRSLPHAEFHIEMDKNKCTIVFDPPVTARYILLKMWNPRQEEMGGNIDIQGVVAKGFAGPRYFPAMELR